MPAPHNSTVPLIDLTEPRKVPKVPFLSYGFRPFFLFAGLYAVVAPSLWVALVLGWFELPTALPGLLWHGHEMLFGFVGAAIAGFLLTAVPNWTGRLPVSGTRLAALATLWLAGRIAVTFGAGLPDVLVAVVDVSFLAIMALSTAREVWLSRTRKNAPIVLILTLLAITNGFSHAEAWGGSYETAQRAILAGLCLVMLLTAVIGGRVVPSFTSSWRAKAKGITDDRPRGFGPIDIAALVLSAAAVLTTITEEGGAVPGGLLWLAAGIAHLLRLSGWKGLKTLSEPIVWVLHLGYLWLSLGMVLIGISAFTDAVPALAGWHAVAMGGFGTMILAIMTRASLGHTGRVIRAARPTVAAYGLVSVAAGFRIGGILTGAEGLLPVAWAAWAGAFVLFVWVYAPILLKPRA